MGLFEKIFGKRPATNQGAGLWGMLNGYTPIFTNWDGETYENFLVRSAIDARARHIAKLKPDFMGSAQNQLRTQLRNAPNDWTTWSQFLYRLSTLLDANNTAFIVPILDSYANTIGLTLIDPNQYELVNVEGEPWVRFTFGNGLRASIELSRVGIMTKFQKNSDYFGENNKALDSTMQLLNIQDQAIEESAKHSTYYSFYAKIANFANKKDMKKERESFAKNNLNNGDSGILLFPNTYSEITQVKPTTFTVDADQRKAINENVFNYFGVNEEVIQNSAIGDKLEAFFNGAIEPFAIQLSEVITRMLFTPKEISFGNKFVVSANRLQYMTVSEKVSFSTMAQQMGLLTINEFRELFNYEPLDESIGNQIPVRGEYYSALTGEKIGGGKEKEDPDNGTDESNGDDEKKTE